MTTDFKNIHSAYTLVSSEYIDEVKSQAAMFKHNKTGACVAVLSNEDKNKVFDIIFRTTPKDSTGVAHILEHSVLCGSKHFPVKDPFVELVKGSLNTFLNAMTYPDKTMYPVASCNDKDFQNLMHVYLDSVFYPDIYRHKEIFLQEGWHYALEDADKELTYNGVVYNEMKGAFSSPEQVLERRILSSLFPDTTYGQESGGDPDHIPDLTYEDFLDFHRKYYHPSNSYIYLYGDFDVYEKLDFIDKEYLSHFDYLDVDSQIQMEKPFGAMKEETGVYSIGSGEDEEDNTYLAYSVVLKDSLDPMMYVAFQVLDYALMSCPGAPLKKALIESGIAKDVYCSYERSIRQPFLSIIAKNSNAEDKDRFLGIIRETLSKIVSDGINKNSLKAALNTMEFKFREADYGWVPGGLMYGILMMDSWLYDKDQPFIHLKCFKTFNDLRKQIDTGYFENLISTWLLDNPHASLVILKPEKGLSAASEQALKEKLAEKKAAMTPEEIREVVDATHHLAEYQETPSSQEALKTIPMLSLEDIDKNPIPLVNKEQTIGGFPGLYHDYETKGIGYLRLLFDMDGLPVRLIPYAGLLSSVLGNIDTEHYEYQDLNNEIRMYTGGIYTGATLYAGKTWDSYNPRFEISGRALTDQMGKMGGLIREILFHSRLDDKKRIKEIIDENVSRLQMALNSSGHAVAVSRATSYFSEAGAYKELLSGVDYYRFLKKLASDFNEVADDIVSGLRETADFLFRRDNIMVDFTGRPPYIETAALALEGFEDELTGKAAVKEDFKWTPGSKNEGFVTPGTVQYDVMAGNFVQSGFKYHGGLNVLKVIMEYEYLWINLRVKGGAYGCMSSFGRNGNAYFASYRDPNLEKTLDIYRKCADYLRNFEASDRDMLKYIIGAISAADTPLNPYSAAARSLGAYFSGLTGEDLQKTRNEILSANVETIRGFAGLVENFVSQENICVVGSEASIEKNRELFKTVETLL
ncbi:insulinase family protein [Catenibacillus scindens]